jgi:hypothetical protein
MKIKQTKYGKGLFATKRYITEQLIGIVKGKIYKEKDIPADSELYVMEMTHTTVIDPKPPFRYLNHNCNPNAELVKYKGKMTVVAKRHIRSGQQITIDYGWNAENAIPCKCKSKKCRGWIVHANELHKLHN